MSASVKAPLSAFNDHSLEQPAHEVALLLPSSSLDWEMQFPGLLCSLSSSKRGPRVPHAWSSHQQPWSSHSTAPWVLPGLLRYTWAKWVTQSAIGLLGFIPLDPEMWCFRGRIQDLRIGVVVGVPLLYKHCICQQVAFYLLGVSQLCTSHSRLLERQTCLLVGRLSHVANREVMEDYTFSHSQGPDSDLMHYTQPIISQSIGQPVCRSQDCGWCQVHGDPGQRGKVSPTYSRSEPEHGLLDPGPSDCHIFGVSLAFNSCALSLACPPSLCREGVGPE